jgi:predicted permease
MSGFWRWWKEQLARMRGSLSRRTFEAEFDDELETHLAMLAERFVRQGLSPQEARYAARKQFGGVAQMKDDLRERGTFRPLEAVHQDIRYVLRQFRKSPLFAAAAIVTLALGIGANTAIFTLVDQLVLRLLPIKDPQQVVELVAQGRFYGDNMGPNAFSYTMYQALRDHNQVFDSMMCRRAGSLAATFAGGSELLSGEFVSGNYFRLLGIEAAAGRVFSASDDLRPRANPVAVLSYEYWKDRFAASEQAIGRTLLINNYPLTIVGVAQPGFRGLEPGLPTQVFVPMMMTPALARNDSADMFNSRLRWVNVYGRLRPDISRQHAQSALQPLFHDILDAEMLQPGFAKATPYDRQQFLKMWLQVIPGGQGNALLRQQYEKPLWVLMGVTGFVLLIACANLASLLAARAAGRRKEIAVRLAIGSSRARLLQQLMTESLLLALAGGAAGITLAIVLSKKLLAFLPENPTGYAISSSPDWRIVCFASGISVLTGLVFGLIPAWQAARPDLADTLKANAASTSGGTAQVSFRKLLVGTQIALSLLLLVGAMLFIRSLSNLRAVNPGFQTQSLVEFDVDLGSIGYDLSHARSFYNELETRLNALPGVKSAGVATNAVLKDSDWESVIHVAGRQNKPGENTLAYVDVVSPGYFKTLGIHLISGRTFRESDTANSQKVAVVSESFARHYFGDEPAIGHFIGRGYEPDAPSDMEIVGVVNDIDYQNLREKNPRQLYMCAAQAFVSYATVYVKAEANPRSLLATARRVVHDMEPKAPVLKMMTLENQLDESLYERGARVFRVHEVAPVADALAVAAATVAPWTTRPTSSTR